MGDLGEDGSQEGEHALTASVAPDILEGVQGMFGGEGGTVDLGMLGGVEQSNKRTSQRRPSVAYVGGEAGVKGLEEELVFQVLGPGEEVAAGDLGEEGGQA